MATKGEQKEEAVDPRESDEEKLNRWLTTQFKKLGFKRSMAEDLAAERVDWREAERLLAKDPPGGTGWVYWYLMP